VVFLCLQTAVLVKDETEQIAMSYQISGKKGSALNLDHPSSSPQDHPKYADENLNTAWQHAAK